MTDLTTKHCEACEGWVAPLQKTDAEKYLQQTPGWNLKDNGKEISRDFKFKNFYETMAFVNALAWMAHQENHHPDITVGYNYCHVSYSTHAVKGLTENDFICAAKINQLLG